MRMLPLVTVIAGCSALLVSSAEVWKAAPIRSTNSHAQGLVFRFERHPKGEVFTLDQMERDGRATTSSTMLYLDGKERVFQGFGCSGTQLSRRLDSQTVEILRTCSSGQRTRFVRRSTMPTESILEITEQKPDGQRIERRVALAEHKEETMQIISGRILAIGTEKNNAASKAGSIHVW
jgi:hypothetical protein